MKLEHKYPPAPLRFIRDHDGAVAMVGMPTDRLRTVDCDHLGLGHSGWRQVGRAVFLLFCRCGAVMERA